MALEDLLKDLAAAVKENTEVTRNLVSLRADAIENVKAAAGSTKPAAGKAVEPAAAKAVEPAAAKAVEPAAAVSGVDEKVIEEFRNMIAGYMSGATRPEEREARKAKVKALLQHDAIKKPGTPANVFDVTNIRDDAVQVFRDNFTNLMARGDLTAAPTAGGLLD